MFYGEGTQIKLFSFYNSDTSIGAQERTKVEREVNAFLSEYDGHIIKIEMQNNIIMIVYKAY